MKCFDGSVAFTFLDKNHSPAFTILGNPIILVDSHADPQGPSAQIYVSPAEEKSTSHD